MASILRKRGAPVNSIHPPVRPEGPTPQGIKEDERVDRLEGAHLPQGHLVEHRVRDRADQVRRTDPSVRSGLSDAALVIGMSVFLKVLSVVGTAAMIWVGGGIIVHGLEGYGLGAISHAIEGLAEGASHDMPAAGAVGRLVTAAASGLVGLLAGLLLIPVVGKAIAPVWSKMRALWSGRTTGSPVRDGGSTPRSNHGSTSP